MAELREVKLEKIRPNPWRDGSGKATWESVGKLYPLKEDKLEALMISINQTDFWTGVEAREVDGFYEIAYGHHRVEAARRLGLKTIPVAVRELSDTVMLQKMWQENLQEHNHNFYSGVVLAVEAVVKAYGEGKVELEKPGKDVRKDLLRVAPGFGRSTGPVEGPKVYTAQTVAEKLGAAREAGAAERIRTALDVLSLFEAKMITRKDIDEDRLGPDQVRQMVGLLRANVAKAEEKVETQREFLEKEAKRAMKENNKNKVRSLEKKLDELENESPKEIVRAGREAISAVKEFYTGNMTEALQAAAEKLELEKKAAKKPEKPKGEPNITWADSFLARIDSTLRDDDSDFNNVCELASRMKGRRVFKDIDAALTRLARRAIARARTLRKAQK